MPSSSTSNTGHELFMMLSFSDTWDINSLFVGSEFDCIGQQIQQGLFHIFIINAHDSAFHRR